MLSAVTRLVRILDGVGGVTKRPPVWAVVAAGLVAFGKRRGRDAAVRGGTAYAIAAVLANLVCKPLVHRKRPAGASAHAIGPVTSSFPSGHAATDVAFILSVSQVVPVLFLPLSGATMAGHWSLVRTRAHHLTDVLAGGALGVAVALALRAWWPTTPLSGHARDRRTEMEEPLMTTVDGAQARLAVHIEPVTQAEVAKSQGRDAGGQAPNAALRRPVRGCVHGQQTRREEPSADPPGRPRLSFNLA